MRKLRDVIAERERDDPRDLNSRTDAKKARVAAEERLAALAKRLVELPARQLAKLELPDDVARAVGEARRIESTIALNRQLRVVRRTLRAADFEALEYAVERVVHPEIFASAAPNEAARWAQRIATEGPSAVDALSEQVPGADAQQLKQLARNVRKAPPDQAARPKRALLRALERALRERPNRNDPPGA